MARVKIFDKNTQKWVYADRSFGKIPVKGVDYYTEEDKVEFESFIIDELAKRGQLEPEFANNIEKCIDTSKLYVLPDGYIYAYLKGDGYTNLVPTSTDKDGAVFNSVGYQDGYCLDYSAGNGTGLVTKQQTGHVATGFIPVTCNDVVRISGATWVNTNKNVIAYFDENKNPLGCYTGNGYNIQANAAYTSEGIDVICLVDKSQQSVTVENGITTFNMIFIDKDSTNTSDSAHGRAGYHVKYMRISAEGNGSNMVVTVNEDIAVGSEAGYAWRNTGHAFVPADYEDRIVALEEETSELEQQVEDIVAGNTAIAAISKFDPAEYGVPVLYLTGNIAGMTKENAVTLEWAYGESSGSCTLKWQGSSSLAYEKKNYTIKFDNAIDVGWGSQNKYCLKANYIDYTHARNIVSAKLWGKIVASRSPYNSTLAACPNYGAIDGFPIAIMLNGEFHGLYTWNIPKDGWMFGMVADANQTQAIVCANDHTTATQFKGELSGSGKDLEIEFASDKNNVDWISTSLNRLINACINSSGTDLDTTIAQYLDWESAIDYYIFTTFIDGRDMTDKNYLLVTYDGVKWIFSAYDMDSTYGLRWNGKSSYRPDDTAGDAVTFINFANKHKVFEMIKRFKTDELKSRYTILRDSILSECAIIELFENFAWAIPSRLLDEDIKLYKTIPGTSTNNINQILRWIHNRLVICDQWIDALPAQEIPRIA